MSALICLVALWLPTCGGSGGNGVAAATASGGALKVTLSPLTGEARMAYSGTLQARGGKPPYAWKITAGVLANGLALNPSEGVIEGIPTDPGEYEFTVRVEDSSKPSSLTASQDFKLTIEPALHVATTALQAGYLEKEYGALLTAGGGIAPYAWSIASGSLPPGLQLDRDSGTVTGAPTQSGQFSLTISVKDSRGASAAKEFNVQISGVKLDKYGGMTDLPCPKGTAAHFYTEKIGNRWFLCTPAGNAFWLKAVYNVDPSGSIDYQGVNNQEVVKGKYGDANVTWGPQMLRRLLSWGFNATAEYASTYVRATTTSNSWPGDHSQPVKVPFVTLVWPAYYALTNRDGMANGPTKEILRIVREDVYSGWRNHFPDIFDPNYAQWLNAAIVRDVYYSYSYSGPHKDYFIGFNVDDTDWLFGFGTGPDFKNLNNGSGIFPGRAQPHLGWMVLVTAPTQQSSSELNQTYTDTRVYTKQELSDWLSARYNNSVSALNTAWGSSYTTFGSSGGWGTGSGLLDEDGRHPWVPQGESGWVLLEGATAAMKQDLDDFLLHLAQTYFRIARTAVKTNAPGFLYLGPTTLGGWGTPPRKQILQAAAEYVDVVGFNSIPPGCVSGCPANDDQARIDFVAQHLGDKPWFSWEGFFGQPDSYMSPYPPSDTTVSQSPTQEARGRLYENRLDALLNAKDSATGTYHIVGFKWWELYDNAGERANWGLATRRDNAYDGAEARQAPGADAWGYPTGGERADYGDFLSSVRKANLGVYTTLLGQQ